MKNEKNIEELFREGLQNYEAPVDPALWNSIQSGIGASGSAGAAAAASGFSALKIAVGVLIAGGIGAGIYALVDSRNEAEPVREVAKKEVVIEETTPEQTEMAVEHPAEEKQGWVEIKVKKNSNPTPENVVENSGSEARSETSTNATGSSGESTTNNSVTGGTGTTQNTGTTENNSGTGQANSMNGSEENPNTEESAKPQLEVILSETEGEAPLEVAMEVRSSEGIVFWQILGPEGSDEGKGKNLTRTFNKPGNYLIVTTLLDNNGNQVRKETAVQVYPKEILKIADKLRIQGTSSYMINPQGFNNKLELEFDISNIDPQSFVLVVWTRSGEEVFKTEDVNQFWDGRNHSGAYVEAGQYFVLINVKDKAGNAQKPIKTSVMVR